VGVEGKRSPIPVTRRHHLQVFTDALEAQGVSSKSIVRRLGLPMWQYGGADDWIPLKDSLVLLRQAARAAGDEQFGMLVSRTRHPASTTTMGRRGHTSPTLYHALKTTCRVAKRHTSLAHVWMFDAGDKLWLCRDQFAGMSAGLRQHEQYVIGFFLELIRHAAGPTWQPAEMWVSAPRQPRLEESDDLAEVDIRYDRPHTAIALPKRILSRSLGSKHSFGSSPAMDLEHLLCSPPDEFAGSLSQILMTLMMDRPPSLNEVAEIICLHPRTLQRRLHGAGVTYQSVVDEARFRASTTLLKQTGATATEVGCKLGYSHLSSFSRAFSRYAGVSPRQYLHLNTQS
jgi:AraC-like DNA-binding protein